MNDLTSLSSAKLESIASANLRRFLSFLKVRQEKKQDSKHSDYRGDAATYTSDFSKNAL